MEKIYKTSKVKFITDIAIGAGAAAFIGLILTRFMDGYTKPAIIAAVLFALYARMICWDKITVTLTDKELRIKQGKEEEAVEYLRLKNVYSLRQYYKRAGYQYFNY